MRRSILFVDDEPQLLGGLRRMLWDKRDVWDMHFAEGGAQALAFLETTPVDVVVSDVRMPGMDGPEFLEAVRQRWPGTVRLILSGHSDRDFIFRSVKPAHQFLSKPCSPRELTTAINRVLRLADIFTDERVRDAVARVETLPVLPSIFAELTEELRSPNASVNTIGDILARDVGMATGLLRLVNSSFFGMPQRVSSTRQAVTLLGLETIRALVLAHGLFSRFDADRYPGFGLGRLWDHSLRVARMAKVLATLEDADKVEKDACFMAGMVHDVGKLMLAELFETEYREVLTATQTRNVTPLEAEEGILAVSHAAVGAYLLGLWGFEEAVVFGVAGHHRPGTFGDGPPLAIPLVHAANALDHELVVIHGSYAPHPLDTVALDAMGYGGRAEAWREACRDVLQGGDGE